MMNSIKCPLPKVLTPERVLHRIVFVFSVKYMFFKLQYIIVLELMRENGNIGQYQSEHCWCCIPSVIEIFMICEIEWILVSDALLDQLDKLINMSFGECSIKGQLSKFKICARLEGAPGFCEL